MKKRKNTTLTKPVFWKIFLKRMLVIAVIAVTIGVVGTYIASYFYGMHMASVSLESCHRFAKELYYRYDYCENNEQFEKYASLLATMNSAENKICVLVDGSTGKILAQPSNDTLFLAEYYQDGTGQLDGKVEIYTCESAEVVDAIRESKSSTMDSDEMFIEPIDFYLKGSTFLPGKVEIKTYGYEEDSVLAKLDFTPEDTTGYEHVVNSLFSDEKSYGMYCVERSLRPEVIQCMEETVAKLDCSILNELHVSEFNEIGSLGENACFSAYGFLPNEEDEYIIIEAHCYNFFENVKNQCLLSYLVLTIIALMLAVVIATVSYMNQRNYYDMDQYRRDITNTMAHDLKSPLMVISGYAENLLEQDLPEKAQHFSKFIMENTTYMNQIIEKTLELSKVENGSYKLQKESVDLKTITNDVVKNYKQQLDQNGLEVQMTGECELTTDKIAMTQVLDNLICNAVKYSVQGSAIEIQMEKHSYTISNVSAVVFDVDVQDLVKPFVKGDDSRSGKKGSGIGLTIVKNLCEQQGYELSLACIDGVFVVKIEC